MQIDLFWTGDRWASADLYFAILQRALWVELDFYGGELWEMQ